MIWSPCRGPGSKSVVFAPFPKGGKAGNHVPIPSLQSCMDRKRVQRANRSQLQQGHQQPGSPQAKVAETPTRECTPFWDWEVLGSIMICCSPTAELSVVAAVVLLLWFSAWQPPGTVLAGSQQQFSAALCQPLGTASPSTEVPGRLASSSSSSSSPSSYSPSSRTQAVHS